MSDAWPDLSTLDLPPTLEALHLWTQIVGKVKLGALPWLNESWHVPLQVTARGLATGLVPHGDDAIDVEFDFRDTVLKVRSTSGADAAVPLPPGSVADFHSSVVAALAKIGAPIPISPLPSEIEGAIPFAEDRKLRPFDPEVARAFHGALVQAQRVFHRFRSRFTGKCSPIHFFWGSFDLAVTRFSGRPAPQVQRGGPNFALAVARDVYADEQASCGFWPGGRGFEEPGFYVEAWPAPDGFPSAAMAEPARYVEALGEWVLPYAAVRASHDPNAALLDFLQAGYEAVANGCAWDRTALERPEGPIGRPPVPDRT